MTMVGVPSCSSNLKLLVLPNLTSIFRPCSWSPHDTINTACKKLGTTKARAKVGYTYSHVPSNCQLHFDIISFSLPPSRGDKPSGVITFGTLVSIFNFGGMLLIVKQVNNNIANDFVLVLQEMSCVNCVRLKNLLWLQDFVLMQVASVSHTFT